MAVRVGHACSSISRCSGTSRFKTALVERRTFHVLHLTAAHSPRCVEHIIDGSRATAAFLLCDCPDIYRIAGRQRDGASFTRDARLPPDECLYFSVCPETRTRFLWVDGVYFSCSHRRILLCL